MMDFIISIVRSTVQNCSWNRIIPCLISDMGWFYCKNISSHE
nr:MAG TPA: hypothetical protein [Caudoviricetes sp.]